MKKENYSELLKDPRWQKKRLEIMQRDEFACQHCGSEHKELHVHHKYYCYDRFPWEYEDHCYITLCNECHEEEHNNREFDHELEKLNHQGFTMSKITQMLHNIRLRSESGVSVFETLSYWDDIDERANYLDRDIEWEKKHLSKSWEETQKSWH